LQIGFAHIFILGDGEVYISRHHRKT
jgi:hypothetical protein